MVKHLMLDVVGSGLVALQPKLTEDWTAFLTESHRIGTNCQHSLDCVARFQHVALHCRFSGFLAYRESEKTP